MSIFAVNEVPISEVLESELGMKLGRLPTKVKCIFHADDTPSWNIYEGDRGSYCYGCGKAYSTYDVLKNYLGWEYSEIMEFAEIHGIDTGSEREDKVDNSQNEGIAGFISALKKNKSREDAKTLEKYILKTLKRD